MEYFQMQNGTVQDFTNQGHSVLILGDFFLNKIKQQVKYWPWS